MSINIDKDKLKRNKPEQSQSRGNGKRPIDVTAGEIGKVIDLAFNPSRDKIREVTIVDRMQARLLPQLDIIDLVWQYIVEIGTYRQDSKLYKELYNKEVPEPPNLIDEFTYRTAQWQKSVLGKNLERATDLALAETEARAGIEDGISGKDLFED